MRRLLILLTVCWACWLPLAGCSKSPGESEFEGGVRELKDGNNVRAKALFEKSINRRPGSDENAMAFNYIGITSWRLGQVQQAVDAFEDSRRISPTLVEPIYNEGVVLSEGGDTVRAVELLTEAARMDPTDARPLEILGRLYTSRSQWPEARRALYGALDRTPNSARILTALALVELGAGDEEKAVAALMQALDKNSRYAPALYDLAVIYEKNVPDAAKAQSYYEKYLDAAKKDPHVEIAEAALKKLRGEPPAAAPAEKKKQPVVVVSTTSAPPASASAKKGSSSVEELLREAAAESEKGHADRALDLCLQAAAKAGEAKKPDLQEKALRVATKLCFDQPKAHTALGDYLLEAGQDDAALKAYKQATVLNSTYAPAQLGMARAAMKAGEYDTALVGLKEAVKADPKNPDALWLLAKMYAEQLNRPELAAKACRDFAQQFPNDPRAAEARAQGTSPAPKGTVAANPGEAAGADRQPAVDNVKTAPESRDSVISYKKPVVRNTKAAVQAFNQGTKYQEKGDWDRAIYYYLRSLENDDMIASTFYNLGVSYATKGERAAAKEAYLRALEIQPSMDNARYNLALVYRDGADFASATRLLEDVVHANPGHYPSHYVLGLLYADSPATYAQAKEHYGKFLELAPNDPAARSARLWLETH